MIAIITTRRDYDDKYCEWRDSLDIKLIKLLKEHHIASIMLPNDLENASNIIANINFDLIILSGGGDVNEDNSESIDRTEIEKILINHAIKKNKAIIGICRGMQAILKYFNIPIQKISGHVTTEHVLTGTNIKVNSYHNFGLLAEEELKDFDILFKADDGSIEAIKHKTSNILGIMWHPERYTEFRDFDFNLINEFIDNVK